MSSIRIPTESELRERLNGIDALLTARKWERAAIVYAFTEVGEVGRGRFYKPEPPRMHIRTFAAQGFSGLTTNKAVSRYRDAWVTAVSNGWAVPVNPGDEVNIPDEPFPAWPYGNVPDVGTDLGDAESMTDPDRADHGMNYTEAPGNVASLGNHRDYVHRDYVRRSVEARVLDHIDTAVRSLARIAEVRTDEMDEEIRRELVDKLSELNKQTRDVMRLLRGQLASV